MQPSFWSSQVLPCFAHPTLLLRHSNECANIARSCWAQGRVGRGCTLWWATSVLGQGPVRATCGPDGAGH
jgi:hypothetical protein